MKRTKYFRIVDEINSSVCTNIEAASESYALMKFRTGMLTSGIYQIIKEDDNRPRLVTSFGSSFRADAV